MDGVKAILKAQFRMAKNFAARIKTEPRLKVVLIVTAMFFFWFGALGGFYKGMRFFHNFPLVGPLLLDETIYLFFSALFLMLTMSSLIICYTTFYTSQEVEFLFSTPIQDTVIFFYRFSQSMLFSSWAFLFLGVPFVIAYAFVKHVPWWFYTFLPVYIIPFLILPTALASLIILIFMRFLDFRKMKYLLIGIIGAVLVGLYWGYKVNIRPSFSSKTEIDFLMNELLQHLRFLKFPLFPGYWISRSVVSAGVNNLKDALFYFFTFAITTLFFLQVDMLVAQKIFYTGWVSSRGGRKEKRYPVKKGVINWLERIFAFFPRSTAALIIKDIKIFFRDPGQWSQFLIYFSILGLYIFNLRNIPTEAIGNFWEVTITFLNLMATILVLASLTVRFLYPAMSLEGNKIWVLGLAPITFRRLIFQKVIMNFIGFFIISESLMYATNVILKTSRTLTYVSCGVAGLASFGLVGLSIGLGSLYPNFKEDNPNKIVSGFGGTVNFILAILYVALLLGSFALPFYSYEVYHAITAKTFHALIFVSWGIALLTTAIAGLVTVIMGYKKLERMEY